MDAVFVPTALEMYPGGACTSVDVAGLRSQTGMCGGSRPHFFGGVCTVVAKLLLATMPDVAVFGQKDGQQSAILRRMVRDMLFPVDIVISPTVRGTDGLALSSRNRYLTEDERHRATSINRGLQKLRGAYLAGETDAEVFQRIVTDCVEDQQGNIDYVELVDYDTLEPLTTVDTRQHRDFMCATAAHFGQTRLIDNIVVLDSS